MIGNSNPSLLYAITQICIWHSNSSNSYMKCNAFLLQIFCVIYKYNGEFNPIYRHCQTTAYLLLELMVGKKVLCWRSAGGVPMGCSGRKGKPEEVWRIFSWYADIRKACCAIHTISWINSYRLSHVEKKTFDFNF